MYVRFRIHWKGESWKNGYVILYGDNLPGMHHFVYSREAIQENTTIFEAHFYQKCYDNHRRTKPHQYYFEQLQFQDQRGLDYLIWCMD
jgi:hypothetical protein